MQGPKGQFIRLLGPFLSVKTRSRVLRAGFGSASADKFLSESVRILAERLTQSELVPRLSIVCHNPHLR